MHSRKNLVHSNHIMNSALLTKHLALHSAHRTYLMHIFLTGLTYYLRSGRAQMHLGDLGVSTSSRMSWGDIFKGRGHPSSAFGFNERPKDDTTTQKHTRLSYLLSLLISVLC